MVPDYPEGAKSGLRARFRKRADNHESAFFELLLYQIFLRLGLSPKVEPTPRKGRGRPDFAIKTRSGAVYYVEANVAGLSGHSSEDPLDGAVLDAIDQLAVQGPTQISLEREPEAGCGSLHHLAASRRKSGGGLSRSIRRKSSRTKPMRILTLRSGAAIGC